MREASIEAIFKNRLQEAGCAVYKWVAPGNDGVPDRIVCVPGGRVVFVELKTLEGRLSPIQKVQIRRLQKTGQEVRVLYGLDAVYNFCEEIKGGIHGI